MRSLTGGEAVPEPTYPIPLHLHEVRVRELELMGGWTYLE